MPLGDAQQAGFDFEDEMAKRLGLLPIPGSGSQWYSKLDLKGRMARWSLKHTTKDRFMVTTAFVDEAVAPTQGLSGDGSVPAWLIRLDSNPEYDLVMFRLKDVDGLEDAIQVTFADKTNTKASDRRERGRVPELLRDRREFT